jgi:hypothetical protein
MIVEWLTFGGVAVVMVSSITVIILIPILYSKLKTEIGKGSTSTDNAEIGKISTTTENTFKLLFSMSGKNSEI